MAETRGERQPPAEKSPMDGNPDVPGYSPTVGDAARSELAGINEVLGDLTNPAGFLSESGVPVDDGPRKSELIELTEQIHDVVDPRGYMAAMGVQKDG